jgi:ABC-2 type transport system ATP-binding protein
MTNIIEVSNLTKQYQGNYAIKSLDWRVAGGSIVGLIGPNGAGKTTLLRALLGLTHSEGTLQVMGKDPRTERHQLMQDVAFIADTAVLPRWLRVDQLISYVEGVQPKFDRAKAERFLDQTSVGPKALIGTLSKGMMVQLHLALTLAVDARLLILDEPTLGLDILYRKQFFDQLLNDYFDAERTIVISTHQVEEVQHILTHFVFLKNGEMLMNAPMTALEDRFVEVHALGENAALVSRLRYFGSRHILGGQAFIFDSVPRHELEQYGACHTPAISDLFVAAMAGGVR